MDVPEKTPEQEAAELEVAIVDAVQPLVAVARAVEGLAARLCIAAARGDTERVINLGHELSTDEAGFGKAYTAWLGARPDRPGFRGARPVARGVVKHRGAMDAAGPADRMSG